MFKYPSSLGLVTYQPEPYVKIEHTHKTPNVQQVPVPLEDVEALAEQAARVVPIGEGSEYGWVTTAGGRFPVYADGRFLKDGFWASRWLLSWQVGNYSGPEGPNTGPPKFRHSEIPPLLLLPSGIALKSQMLTALRIWGRRKPGFLKDLAKINPEDHAQVAELYKRAAVQGGPVDVDAPWALHVSCRGASYAGQPGRMPKWGIHPDKIPSGLLDPIVAAGTYLGGLKGPKGPATQTASIAVITEEEVLLEDRGE